MGKKFLSIISAIAAVTAILPGMNLEALNTTQPLTANAKWSSDGTKYYSGKSYYTGWHTINGDKYFFEEDGTKRTDSWVCTDDKLYFVDESGKALKHTWKYIAGTYRYFRYDGSLATNRWVKNPYNDNYYYFDESGFPVISPEYFGITEGVETTIENKKIIQTKTINGKNFKLVIDLREWAQGADPYQIENIADLYWGCYPKMYNRFVKDVSDPEDIMYIHIKPCGGIAGTGGHDVDINDDWLRETKDDYDAVTHELAHTLQNRFYEGQGWEGWDGDKCECSDFIENFADYCRYVYAYKDGYYNDKDWNPEKIKRNDAAHHNSIRFLIWLDYKYSTSDYDPIVAFSDICRSKKYNSNEWGIAWSKVFEGSTALKTRTIANVWNEYIYDTYFSDAKATTGDHGIKSQLIQRYPDLRSKLAR